MSFHTYWPRDILKSDVQITTETAALFPPGSADAQKAARYQIEAAHTERQVFVVAAMGGFLLGRYLWPRRA